MTNKHMEVWQALCETDPNFTKPFNNGRFRGTDINPMYRWRKLTELFGPAGIGWGVDDHTANMVDLPNGDKMICISVSAWYIWAGEKRHTPPGFGQDYVVRNGKSDDESAKKGFTDALGNAFKYLGVCADVFMGQYDDSKYTNALKEKYSDKPAPEPNQPTTAEPKDQNDPVAFPDIPEDRQHLLKMKDGHPMFIHQEQEEAITDLANTAAWYIGECDRLEAVSTVVKQNHNVLKGLRTEAGLDPIEQGCCDWAMKKLSNTKTERGLKAAWSKIGAEVNMLKDSVPEAHTGITKAFKERKKEIINA